jgi:hypothetical protein
MISEFALDPELVATWRDPRDWAFFREAFSDDSGRLISRYPPKWDRAVLKAFHNAHANATRESAERWRLDAWLEWAKGRMVRREGSHEECDTWLEKALAEHRDRPFQGILSSEVGVDLDAVLTPERLYSERPPSAWSVPSRPPIPRTAQDLTNAVAPILCRCREAVFVDPHFDADKPRYREPFAAMLAVLWGQPRCAPEPQAQLITGATKRGAQKVVRQCQAKLPPRIPAGRKVSVTVLGEREKGEKLHNRYILTLIAGVSFGVGLDEDEERDTTQSDDLCRLTREQLDHRWCRYITARGSYFTIEAEVDIMGTGKGA